MSFRSISTKLHTKLSKETRKEKGIFFTPRDIRTKLFELCPADMTPTHVLEPSFGSGEFLFDVLTRYPAARIHGVELNEIAFADVASAIPAADSHRVTLQRMDFLKYSGLPGGVKADLIIGNPPYFVSKETVKNPHCFTGRGNIFIQFLYTCLTAHLAPDGILAFVLPTSLYNCAYYDPCRKYIHANTTIVAVENVPSTGFYETAQETMCLVIRNCRPPIGVPAPFIYKHAGSKYTYITPYAAELSATTATASTIAQLGCSVKTGEVVWNQHKEILTPVAAGSTPVIYSINIKDGVLRLLELGSCNGGVCDAGCDRKHQYIRDFKGGRPNVGPALLVSRGYGNTAYRINFAVVPAGMEFYGENHVNVVTGPAAAIGRIAASLDDPRTAEFIERFIGNGALSKTELECVLPVW